MIKVTITNQLTNYSCGSKFSTLEEAQVYINKQTSKLKHPMGKPERYVKTEELPVELQDRVLSVRNVDITDDEGNVVETYEESLVKADYVVVTEDLSQDTDYLLQECLRNRQREYAKLDNLLKEALVEKELGDSTKWDEYVVLRNQVKTNYPKPE